MVIVQPCSASVSKCLNCRHRTKKRRFKTQNLPNSVVSLLLLLPNFYECRTVRCDKAPLVACHHATLMLSDFRSYVYYEFFMRTKMRHHDRAPDHNSNHCPTKLYALIYQLRRAFRQEQPFPKQCVLSVPIKSLFAVRSVLTLVRVISVVPSK